MSLKNVWKYLPCGSFCNYMIEGIHMDSIKGMNSGKIFLKGMGHAIYGLIGTAYLFGVLSTGEFFPWEQKRIWNQRNSERQAYEQGYDETGDKPFLEDLEKAVKNYEGEEK